jgi:hypothetical protein
MDLTRLTTQVLGQPGTHLNERRTAAVPRNRPKALIALGISLLARFERIGQPSAAFNIPISDWDDAAGVGFNAAEQKGYLGMKATTGHRFLRFCPSAWRAQES